MVRLVFIGLFVLALSLSSVNGSANSDLCELKGGKCSPKGSCNVVVSTEYQEYCGASQECCNNQKEDTNRCIHYGGECVTNCPAKIRDTRGKDCAPGRFCCIWL